jgi:hypothetical protein
LLVGAFFLAVGFFLLVAALLLRFAFRAPAAFFAVLRCFDFDFFAMDHSVVSGCGLGEMTAITRSSRLEARAISRARHRQGGRMF